jgi:hypothetical protein
MIQTLFPNDDEVFQDDNAPIHTAGTVQSWFEEHEGELQHLPLANTINGFQDHWAALVSYGDLDSNLHL